MKITGFDHIVLCVADVSDLPMQEILDTLARHDIEVVAGPGERQGAAGTLMSVYFRDPDGNLVEVGNRV